MRLQSIVFLLLIGFCAWSLGQIPGGFNAIVNPNADQDAVGAAKWAVDQENIALAKDSTLVDPPNDGTLEYMHILSASDQVVSGQTNYALIYTAKADNFQYTFSAKVLESSSGFYSFFQNAFPEQLGSATPIG
eukprot:TRINITY_DN1890_c0_g2_i1.p6 TRINITY_DN1890_c0_g2~~TRINITY_DN1890_c0_g2_i1.p6  ORF type:complete len:133 (-),score=22.96 TRINITY_DN1890_c0_g2_i1:1204-1602(-)